MVRHLFLEIALTGVVAGLFNSPAKAAMDAAQCENQAANCVGRCADPGGGANNNKCMSHCDRQVMRCLVRVHGAAWRW